MIGLQELEKNGSVTDGQMDGRTDRHESYVYDEISIFIRLLHLSASQVTDLTYLIEQLFLNPLTNNL